MCPCFSALLLSIVSSPYANQSVKGGFGRGEEARGNTAQYCFLSLHVQSWEWSSESMCFFTTVTFHVYSPVNGNETYIHPFSVMGEVKIFLFVDDWLLWPDTMCSRAHGSSGDSCDTLCHSSLLFLCASKQAIPPGRRCSRDDDEDGLQRGSRGAG